MMRNDPVAAAIDALLTDEAGAKVAAARGEFDRAGLTGVHSVLRLYGSTAGPFGGVGCAAMTTFRLTAIYSADLAILFAGGRLFGAARTADVDLGLLNPDEFTRIF